MLRGRATRWHWEGLLREFRFREFYNGLKRLIKHTPDFSHALPGYQKQHS